VIDTVESGTGAGHDAAGRVAYRSDSIGSAIRLIDVFRNAVASSEITAGSEAISEMVSELCRFEVAVLGSRDELSAASVPEHGTETMRMLAGSGTATEIPTQEQVRSIKSQQASVSREREKNIQGMQSQTNGYETVHGEAGYGDANGFGEQDVGLTAAESWMSDQGPGPSTSIQFGPSTSFSEAGRWLAESFTLNRRQSTALRLVCRQLDRVRHDEEGGIPQLYQFIGGEGGTGKSRIIAAIAELFGRMRQSHRLLVTATSGTAAANINGITIHSACKFSKDTIPRGGRFADVDGFALPGRAGLRIDGQTKMDWQEKYVLIIDEVSILGARTLYAVNE
jgi:hypothetical protein